VIDERSRLAVRIHPRAAPIRNVCGELLVDLARPRACPDAEERVTTRLGVRRA